nr:unnamed protein product [Spirometra erinaceieuropaei]
MHPLVIRELVVRLCHQHDLLVPPPDEDIVQQLLASRPRVHPDLILLRQKAGECVSQNEAGFCADVDEYAEFASPMMRAEAYQTIVQALLQTGQGFHDIVPGGKGDARVSSVCPGAAVPEEGVAGTHLLHLALLGESGLAKCDTIHHMSLQSPWYQRRPQFLSAVPDIV